jgi:chemotaxis protein CheC
MTKKLQQINKLAAENASAGLKKLFKRNITLKIAKAQIKNIRALKPIIDPEEMTVGIYLPITGDVHGASLLVLPRETAFALSSLLLKKKGGTTRALTAMGQAALKEVGNIVCGRYFAVFADQLNIKLIENIPSFSFTMFGAVISDIIANFSEITGEALVIEIEFIFKPKVLKSYFLLLFEPKKMRKFFK